MQQEHAALWSFILENDDLRLRLGSHTPVLRCGGGAPSAGASQIGSDVSPADTAVLAESTVAERLGQMCRARGGGLTLARVPEEYRKMFGEWPPSGIYFTKAKKLKSMVRDCQPRRHAQL